MASAYCPKCGSHDVEFEEDGIVECMNCGFRGINFPTEHLLIEDEEDEEVSPIKKKAVAPVKKVSKAKKPAKKSKAKSKAKKGKKK
jgi:Zn ribbon nucleic-acid-binding protein